MLIINSIYVKDSKIINKQLSIKNQLKELNINYII